MKNQISSLSLERERLHGELENEKNSALRIKSDANSARAESVRSHEIVNYQCLRRITAMVVPQVGCGKCQP